MNRVLVPRSSGEGTNLFACQCGAQFVLTMVPLAFVFAVRDRGYTEAPILSSRKRGAA